MLFMRKTTALPSATEALPGRAQAIPTATSHFVNGAKLQPPYSAGLEQAVFGLGCFWGAERKFWELGDGVYATAVGYAGGHTPNPTYEETCSGRTGHTEVVLVVFDPKKISYEKLLTIFWESHNPTQGMRQGNDVGTQYRSAIYTYRTRRRERPINRRRSIRRRLPQKVSAPSPPRSHSPANSILPRTIISNIWRRIPPAIAVWAAPACPARSASV
ncbi:peptide-methionine (S)-S-oxide reductase [Bradyrhizobium sp. LB14.3]